MANNYTFVSVGELAEHITHYYGLSTFEYEEYLIAQLLAKR